MSNITKMPVEERLHGEFHSAASSTSSELTAVAAEKECHSALHLHFNNCHASSVSPSVGWLVQSTDHTDAPHEEEEKKKTRTMKQQLKTPINPWRECGCLQNIK